MPAARLLMRKVPEVFRLKHTRGVIFREISEATGVGKTQVSKYLRRAEVIGIHALLPMIRLFFTQGAQ